MSKEIWKDIEEYNGVYKVSTLGRFKSYKSGCGRIITPTLNGVGYMVINLYANKKRKTWSVHKLLAITFLNHNPNGHNTVIDHINEIKTDNRLENLRIITHRKNISRGKKGSSKYTGVSWNKISKKWRADIQINGKGKTLGLFEIEEDAAMAYSLKLQEINRTKQLSYEQQDKY